MIDFDTCFFLFCTLLEFLTLGYGFWRVIDCGEPTQGFPELIDNF
jgi:hypothetical protein